MKSSLSRLISLFTGLICLIFIIQCGPSFKTRGNKTITETPPPTEDTVFNDEEVTPTLVIPKPNASQPTIYQDPPKKILNNDKTEIQLGQLSLRDAKIGYNSVDRKMKITGQIVILNAENNPETEKEFSLIGMHEIDQSEFVLHDENQSQDSSLPNVKAKAHCLGESTLKTSVNCNHVVVDVFVLYKETYYTEQVELNRTKKTPPFAPASGDSTPAAPPAPVVTPASNDSTVVVPPAPIVAPASSDSTVVVPPAPVVAPASNDSTVVIPPAPVVAPASNDSTVVVPPAPIVAPASSDSTISGPQDEDHSETQQAEEDDESIPGRYQGSAQTINLTDLFSESAHKSPLPKEKPIHPPITQKDNGEIRPNNQSFGFPNSGYLKNSTSILERQEFLKEKSNFSVVNPQRKTYFGTYEMSEILTNIGNYLHKNYSKKLYLSNISAKSGGKLSPHLSHQNGLDADLGYPTDSTTLKFPLVVNQRTHEFFHKNISLDKTYSLYKFLFSQNEIPVARIFVDQKIKNELCKFANTQITEQSKNENKQKLNKIFESIQHVFGHGDHFHLRIKCSKYDPACRDRVYKKMDACFH